MPQTMTEVDDFRKTINQASIEAIFQFAMHTCQTLAGTTVAFTRGSPFGIA
jgi:hypothetical protein